MKGKSANRYYSRKTKYNICKDLTNENQNIIQQISLSLLHYVSVDSYLSISSTNRLSSHYYCLKRAGGITKQLVTSCNFDTKYEALHPTAEKQKLKKNDCPG